MREKGDGMLKMVEARWVVEDREEVTGPARHRRIWLTQSLRAFVCRADVVSEHASGKGHDERRDATQVTVAQY